MKTQYLALVAGSCLLASSAPGLAETYTGWITSVPLVPILHTNNLGQVLWRGNAHTVRVTSTDPRLTGLRLVFSDGAYQPDGTALVWGFCYQQVGTFDTNGQFTATTGLWEITYRGTMGTDNTLQLHLVGNGSGGSIDGLRLEENLLRDPVPSVLDPGKPYNYTGTITFPAVCVTTVLDDFNDNQISGVQYGTGSRSETNGQLTVVGRFDAPTQSVMDSFCFAGPDSRDSFKGISDKQTAEWRADLVHLDSGDTNCAILAVATATGGGYFFHKGSSFAYIFKWSPSGGFSMFGCDKVVTPNSNVVLALAVTRSGNNMAVTARVLDKANPNVVLYQRTVLDTSVPDPTLTTDQFEALTGMRWTDLAPDNYARFTAFGAGAGVYQYTDGHKPAPKAILDNLEVRMSEIPAVGVQPAAMISWFAPSGIGYALDSAPTAQGPWTPLQSVPQEVQQRTVPVNELMKFFRLKAAP